MKGKTINQKIIQEKWFVIDAAGKRIGRIATIAAELLLGKNDPMVKKYLKPNAHVVIVNADKLDIPPKRDYMKFYKNYSGYPGGLRYTDLKTKRSKQPTFPLENAIKGMLPKNTRGNEAFTNLRVYASSEHPHQANKPQEIDVINYKL